MLQYIKKKMSPTSTTNYKSLSTPSIAVAAEGGAAGPTRERAGLEVGTKNEELDGVAGTPRASMSTAPSCVNASKEFTTGFASDEGR
jgi:hypothetical protein